MTATQITYKIVFPIVLSFALFLYFISSFIEPAPKKELTIATGGKSQGYYNTALKYKKLLEEQNVKLNIISTSGSVENIQLLKDKKVDIAFVQGGILTSDASAELESLASVYHEPLWIFYKNRGYKMEYLLEFIDRKVAIGSDGSGTQHLTKQILDDNGITKENTTLLPLSLSQAKEKLKSGEIDALFSVTSLDSPAVVDLLADPSIEVLNIKRIKAYNQKYTFLSSLKLYEGTVDMFSNIPSEDKNILSTTANLVCNKGLNDELIRIFMKQIKKVHHQKSIFAQENQFPSLHYLDIPINKEAKKYILKGDSWLESIFPFWIATQIDRLKILLIPFLTLLFPLIKGILPLYKWSIRSKIYKWYEELEEFEYRDGQSVAELNENLAKLESLKLEVNEQTKVPLSYKGEYYNLILHLNLVSKELRKQINITKKEEK